MISFVIYFAAAALIAYIGRNHKFGWMGWGAISIFFSPLIASLLLMIVRPQQNP